MKQLLCAKWNARYFIQIISVNLWCWNYSISILQIAQEWYSKSLWVTELEINHNLVWNQTQSPKSYHRNWTIQSAAAFVSTYSLWASLDRPIHSGFNYFSPWPVFLELQTYISLQLCNALKWYTRPPPDLTVKGFLKICCSFYQ